MRLFAGIAIACVLLVSSNTAHTQDKHHANKPQETSERQSNNPSPLSPTVEINIGTQANTAQSQPAKTDATREAKPRVTLGELLVALVTLVYAVFSGFTYFSIKKQADIAETTVNALMAGQRAWVMVDIEFNPTGVGDERRDSGVFHGVQIRMNYRNDGQTPAWITERRARLVLITDSVIPEFPDLKNADIIAHGTVPLAVGERHGYGHVDSPLECPADYSPEAIHLIYGVVRYRTAFNGTGETTFGYRVTRGWDRLERLDGSPEWNDNT